MAAVWAVTMVRGVDVLYEIYDEWFHDPPIPIEMSPAPWCRFRKSHMF